MLGVGRSVTGKAWRPRDCDERTAMALAQKLEMPEIVGRVLAARGVGIDGAEDFLNPTLRAHLPDPSHLLGMDEAVARLVQALNAGEVVGVFGDYDVDGATAAALLVRFFSALGRTMPVYIPDRRKEGYGPNLAALMKLRDQGASVVVTVDCGTTAHEPLEAAAAAGLDIIVIDHHVAGPSLPAGAVVVNPNRADETSPHGHLAAVGVAFLLVVALNRALRDGFWYGEGHAPPDPMAWLDLVALGTVCDVVPLIGVNRALVTQGLKVMAGRTNPGIAALADVASVDEPMAAYHAGFVLGPRVNAGGRVGEAGLGARLLTTSDAAEAHAIATQLDQFNRERQAIEAVVQEAALAEAADQVSAGRRFILVAAEGWHPGVIGIVAGRLRERFDRPACVVALEDGVGRGSGRSVPGVALGPAVIAAHQDGILINGGGHAAAAGFTVAEGRIGDLHDFLEQHMERQLDGEVLVPHLGLDGALTPPAATTDLIGELERIGPFGNGNPRPRFAFAAVQVARADVVGNGHVRCFLTASSGGPRLKAIAFRAADGPLGQALLGTSGAALHVAGHMRIDAWQGMVSAQLIIEDAARLHGS